jgi:hypothetical protein
MTPQTFSRQRGNAAGKFITFVLVLAPAWTGRLAGAAAIKARRRSSEVRAQRRSAG